MYNVHSMLFGLGVITEEVFSLARHLKVQLVEESPSATNNCPIQLVTLVFVQESQANSCYIIIPTLYCSRRLFL
jgi:hypothetical protein